MQTLPCPSRKQARDQLSTALTVRKANGHTRGYSATAAQLDEIMALYDAYDAAKGAPNELLKGADLDEELRAAIQEAYNLTQRGRKLSSIRACLMQGIKHCPICGISPPHELDHHLPKAIFQPLSIYVCNLVPICGICNQIKGAVVPKTPEHRYVHAYLEVLPPIRFLRATVLIENGGLVVEFDVDPCAGLPNLLRGRLEHQLQRLRLNERYAREINTYLTSHATALYRCFNSNGAEDVKLFLKQQAETEFACFHLNHWRPVLLIALSNHQDFCDGGFFDILPVAQSDGLPNRASA